MKRKTNTAIIGFLLSLFFIILSIFPMYRYCGIAAVVLPNKSIFHFIGFYSIFPFIFYLYSMLYALSSLIPHNKKKMVFNERKQYIFIGCSIIAFIITFVVVNHLVDYSYVLFFL